MSEARGAPGVELSWSGWGDPDQATELPEAVHELLRAGLGVKRATPVPAQPGAIRLRPPELREAVASELTAVVGAEHAGSDHETRLRHALGKSSCDLLALRSDEPLPAPDLVLRPGTHDEVVALLGICSRERVAVVPFGGGTSVVGGLTPELAGFTGWVALDLRRFNQLHALDEISRVATLGPGLRGPDAEALLDGRGYTLGHYPQSFEFATLGGFAAARSSGQASAGYGRFDDLVVGLRVATPTGTMTLGRAPKSAAGPDLRQLMLGSEGALGVITELAVQVRPRPEQRVYEGWRLADFPSATAVLRRLIQDGPVPTVLRVSDEAETALGLARPDRLGASGDGGCLAIVGYEGSQDDVKGRRAGAATVLRAAGGSPVDGAGEEWERGRFQGPYLRDALLDAGALVETLETVTFWSALLELYRAVSAALREALTDQGTPPVILCHISHVYPAGASLYFTVACAQLTDPVGQWRAAKRAASDAIIAAGGSISHHHGVGRDHRGWLEQEIGAIGVAMLGAVKASVDPAGVLNPGILLAL